MLKVNAFSYLNLTLKYAHIFLSVPERAWHAYTCRGGSIFQVVGRDNRTFAKFLFFLKVNTICSAVDFRKVWKVKANYPSPSSCCGQLFQSDIARSKATNRC